MLSSLEEKVKRLEDEQTDMTLLEITEQKTSRKLRSRSSQKVKTFPLFISTCILCFTFHFYFIHLIFG
jgi:hypothetical protein